MPNGSAAPATYSTGTTNTLTITPVCGSALKNVSATVTANGTQYNTNQSSISITPPSLSISGNSVLCSGSATYSVSNLPCNASVIWSASPAGIVSLSCTSCNSTTITKTGDGSVTLTATVSNVCGSNPIVLNKQVAVGYSLTGTISGSNTPMYTVNSISAGPTTVTFQWPGVTGISCYQSSSNPSVSQTGFIYYPSQSKFWFTLSSGQSITVSFSGTGCGGTTIATRSFTVSTHYYMVTPNPASSSITISPNAQSYEQKTSNIQATSNGIRLITITDVTGVVKQQQEFGGNASKVQMNVSNLPRGTYFVQIKDGRTTTETLQLLINK
ncbi:MAG: T9SS type A sorting domain-containing protein [Ginsengibacter sp.]